MNDTLCHPKTLLITSTLVLKWRRSGGSISQHYLRASRAETRNLNEPQCYLARAIGSLNAHLVGTFKTNAHVRTVLTKKNTGLARHSKRKHTRKKQRKCKPQTEVSCTRNAEVRTKLCMTIKPQYCSGHCSSFPFWSIKNAHCPRYVLISVRLWNFKDGGSKTVRFFGQEATLIKKKILWEMSVHQKLGMILERKVVQKLSLEKKGLLNQYS